MAHIQKHNASVFAANQHIDPGYAYSQAEQHALDTLGKNLTARYRLGFGIFREKTFVGWHLGQQTSRDTFEMSSTGILLEHQRRGLYTVLLPIILETLKKEGFQIVFSRHNLTNNAVIIPKLKAGFVISGFEVDDRFGTLVQLSYFFSPLRRKVIDVRVGQRAPDDEIKKLLF